ncbi:hypothetical protein PQX77_017731 [Marasmius sp. AFHP31]|nr:hypothetical protein PQX77_017731 [Marasmius sp. AFHP31]
MYARTTGLLSAAALLGAASATVVSFEARDITPISSLVARQSAFDPSVIPSSCQTNCAAVVGDIQTCQSKSTDALCGCTTQVSDDMKTCFKCLIDLAPTAEASIQGSYDDYVKTCNSAGANLPGGSIGGGSSGVASGTGSAGGGSSATRTVGGGFGTTGTSGGGSSTPTGSTGNGSSGNGSSGNGSTGNSNSGNSGSSSSAPGGGNGALSTRGNMAVVGGLCAAIFVFLL